MIIDINTANGTVFIKIYVSVMKATCFPLEAQACNKRSRVRVTILYWNLQRALQIFIPILCVSFKMDIRVSFLTPQPQNTYLELDTTELSWNANLQYRIETSHAILSPNNCALHMIEGTWATCFKWHRHHYHHRIENRALVVPCFNDNILTTVVFSLHPRAADFMGLHVASVPQNVRLFPFCQMRPVPIRQTVHLPRRTHTLMDSQHCILSAHTQATTGRHRPKSGTQWQWKIYVEQQSKRKSVRHIFHPLFFTTPNCTEKFHQLTARWRLHDWSDFTTTRLDVTLRIPSLPRQAPPAVAPDNRQ